MGVLESFRRYQNQPMSTESSKALHQQQQAFCKQVTQRTTIDANVFETPAGKKLHDAIRSSASMLLLELHRREPSGTCRKVV